MQSLYSLSCFSPSLCKMFVSFKSNSLTFVKKKKKKKRRPDGAGSCVLEAWDAGETPRMGEDGAASLPGGLCLQLPRLSQGSSPRRSVGSGYVAGRHSDVAAAFPRFSTSSSSGYERLSEEYSQEEGQGLPRHLKLGMVSDSRRLSLASQRDSSCSAASSVSSASSSSTLRGTRAAQRREFPTRKQPHIGELFAANQFLTPLTASPAVFGSPSSRALLQPSSGLVDAGLRSRADADLKDRIILFL